MEQPRPLPIQCPSTAAPEPDMPPPDAAWAQAVLHGDAVPAVASLYHIENLQHWMDLSA
jgi:hypothetical protein